MQTETIAIAMSGGVDSSTVAAMLHAQGHTVVGLTLQLWNQRRLAGREGMPESRAGPLLLHRRRLRRPPRRRAPRHPLLPRQRAGSLRGRGRPPLRLRVPRRPHAHSLHPLQQPPQVRSASRHRPPDRRRKASPPATTLATTSTQSGSRWVLSRPADRSKDQTYFLFGLTQEQLSRTLFPLGDIHKPAVREMAADAGLALAAKPDSQEICFIPGGSYSQFLKAYLDEQGRELPDSSGELVSTQRRNTRPPRGHSQLHRRPAQGPRPQLA